MHCPPVRSVESPAHEVLKVFGLLGRENPAAQAFAEIVDRLAGGRGRARRCGHGEDTRQRRQQCLRGFAGSERDGIESLSRDVARTASVIALSSSRSCSASYPR